ncbi:MAG: DNA translocase FtsK [Nitrospirae bacterium]|nr:MAG: DNA translocase FtsK [Nitrospirota bacterium]
MSIFPRSILNSPRREKTAVREASCLKPQLTGIGFFTIGVLLILSLWSFSPRDPLLISIGTLADSSSETVHNWVGVVGATMAALCLWLWGMAAFAVPVLCMIQGVRAFGAPDRWASLRSWSGAVLLVVALSTLAHLAMSAEVQKFGHGGGVSGQWLALWLQAYFGQVGSLVLLGASLIVAVLLIAPFSLVTSGQRVAAGWLFCLRSVSACVGRLAAYFPFKRPKANKPLKIHRSLAVKGQSLPCSPETRPDISGRKEGEHTGGKDSILLEESLTNSCRWPEHSWTQRQGYRLPDAATLLAPSPGAAARQSDEHLERQSVALTQALQNFAITGKVTEIHPGPVITMYEFQPGPGIKVARIVNLAHDLAMALKATRVRIVAPLPGKSTVGIEVPNPVREPVVLRDILLSNAYVHSRSQLRLALGKDIFGRPIVADLQMMPHLLVAGATGAGKSVGLNSMLLSLLFSAHPDEVKLLLIDPKVLELQVYEGIPHLLCPVLTEPKVASRGLSWVIQEMERRYRLLAEHGVRNIQAFNAKVKRYGGQAGQEVVVSRARGNDSGGVHEAVLYRDRPRQRAGTAPPPSSEETQAQSDPLPYIVLVIDEYADLMMVAPKDVEEKIARLAQMARAAGIHLIVATQRPSVDVVTGLIKANFPARIAYQVSSKVDSRTILDTNGAEALLGAGDMLYMAPGTGRITRLHGPYVSDEEIQRVVAFVKSQNGASSPNVGELRPETLWPEQTQESRDEIYEQAKEIVLSTGQASASLVQRRLRVGYPRAARMIEQMEEEGLVSAPGRDGRREVLAHREAVKETFS